MAQHLPLTAEQYLNQRWQDQFTDNIGGAGVPSFKQLVRIQLPQQYTRTWAINMAAVSTDQGGTWETGANAFPVAQGELELRWGTGAFNEVVEFHYPQAGGTVYVNGSFVQLGGRSSVSDPLVPARYSVWAAEAGELQGRNALYVPEMRDQTTNLGPAASSTKFRPRRANAYIIYTTQPPANSPSNNVRVRQVSGNNSTLDTVTFGSTTVPPYNEKWPIPLHTQCDRLIVTNDDATFNLTFTVSWLLDLG